MRSSRLAYSTVPSRLEYGFPKNGVNEPLISTSHTLLGGGTGVESAVD